MTEELPNPKAEITFDKYLHINPTTRPYPISVASCWDPDTFTWGMLHMDSM